MCMWHHLSGVKWTHRFSSSRRFLGIARIFWAPCCPLFVFVILQLPSSRSLPRLRSRRSGERARWVGGAEARGVRGRGRLHDLLPDLPDLQLQTQLGGKNVRVSGLEGCRSLSWKRESSSHRRGSGRSRQREEQSKCACQTHPRGKSPAPGTAAWPALASGPAFCAGTSTAPCQTPDPSGCLLLLCLNEERREAASR